MFQQQLMKMRKLRNVCQYGKYRFDERRWSLEMLIINSGRERIRIGRFFSRNLNKITLVLTVPLAESQIAFVTAILKRTTVYFSTNVSNFFIRNVNFAEEIKFWLMQQSGLSTKCLFKNILNFFTCIYRRTNKNR